MSLKRKFISFIVRVFLLQRNEYCIVMFLLHIMFYTARLTFVVMMSSIFMLNKKWFYYIVFFADIFSLASLTHRQVKIDAVVLRDNY